MGRLILDTSVLIAVERGKLDVDAVAGSTDDVAIAAVTAAEMLMGAELGSDAQRAKRLASIEATFERVTVETYDLDCARAYAKLLAFTRAGGTPRGAYDLIIAATAIARNRMVVTADCRGFRDLPGLQTRLVP